jgi:hypothetical protein
MKFAIARICLVALLFNLGPEFASGQTYSREINGVVGLKPNHELIIQESLAFSRLAGRPHLQQALDDPNDPVVYHQVPRQPSEEQSRAATVATRTEGPWLTRVIVVTIQFAGEASASNNITESQALQRVYQDNGDSARSYFDAVSGDTKLDDGISDGLLQVKGKNDPNGDVYFLTFSNVPRQPSSSECETWLTNDMSNMVNAQLPSSDKYNTAHSNIVVVNQAVYQGPTGCSHRALATVGPVRSMNKGGRVFISESMFASTLFVCHEMGHNMGLSHSSLTWSNGSPDPLTWPRLEYGDMDAMGLVFARFSSCQAYRLGWAGPTGLGSHKELISGVHEVVPATDPRGAKAKRLLSSQNGYIVLRNSSGSTNGLLLFVEVRQKAPYDENLYAGYYSSPSLRWGNTDPAVMGSKCFLVNTAGNNNLVQAPLTALGQPFTIWNVSVTTLRHYQAVSGTRVNLVF